MSYVRRHFRDVLNRISEKNARPPARTARLPARCSKTPGKSYKQIEKIELILNTMVWTCHRVAKDSPISVKNIRAKNQNCFSMISPIAIGLHIYI